MIHPKHDRLHALERFQELEVEQARSHYDGQQKQLEKGRREASDLEELLEGTRQQEVGLLTGRDGTSVATLRHLRVYSQTQAEDLLLKRQTVMQEEATVEGARLVLRARFERLSATRRLRERRAAERATRLLRARFRRLDDLAVLKNSPSADVDNGD